MIHNYVDDGSVCVACSGKAMLCRVIMFMPGDCL